jgi:transmembrane sensor
MSTNGERVRLLITQQAADWFIANRAGLTRGDQDAFAAWLRASPVHVEEYLSVAVVVRDLRAACANSADSLEDLADRARRETDNSVQPFWRRTRAHREVPVLPRWSVAALALALAGVLSIGLALWSVKWRPTGLVPEVAAVWHFATKHGEQQTQTLADHSVLHLNTDSEVTVTYNEAERIVTLTAGEAFFEVAHEPERTFRVLTGSAQIVDMGTQFNVRLADHATLVTVIQGAVAAGPHTGGERRDRTSNRDLPTKLVRLVAGQQMRITDDQRTARPVTTDTQRTAAWLHRQILFDHEPLQRVATEFNRYAPKPFEIVTPALQNLEVSGVFATDDTDAFIAFLRSLDGVHVEVTSAWIRVSQQ